jgi:putative ABC transport system permease protein
MKLLSTLGISLNNLSRRKGRVALTAIGVGIGTAAVVILVSLGIGMQRNASEQIGQIADLMEIIVMPPYKELSEEELRRVKPGVDPWLNLMTESDIEALKGLPGVEGVYPQDIFRREATISYGRQEVYISIFGVTPAYFASKGVRTSQGIISLERGEMILGAMIPENFRYFNLRPGQEPPPAPDLVDKSLRLTLANYTGEAEPIRKAVQVRVVGLLTPGLTDLDWNAFMPVEQVRAMNDWAEGRKPGDPEGGYVRVVMRAEHFSQVIPLANTIKDMGYEVSAPATIVEGFSNFYRVLQIIMGGIGAIALLVAGFGIANTMTMSIMERTREIGLMKAVGASNSDVLAVFLMEASAIGLIGGLGGAALGWGGGELIDNAIRDYFLNNQAGGPGMFPGGLPGVVMGQSVVFTPAWLLAFTLVFSIGVGFLSGVYPALRAATLQPVQALKYE